VVTKYLWTSFIKGVFIAGVSIVDVFIVGVIIVGLLGLFNFAFYTACIVSVGMLHTMNGVMGWLSPAFLNDDDAMSCSLLLVYHDG
jgi:hypothetical protein